MEQFWTSYAFNKGRTKLIFPNKDLLFFFWCPYDDFIMVGV